MVSRPMIARISIPKPLPETRLEPNVLDRSEFDKFLRPRSFPEGKDQVCRFHDPFCQESVMVSRPMILSSRKASWFFIP